MGRGFRALFIVIKSFKNQGTKDIFDGVDSKLARKTCPQNAWKVARRKLMQVNVAGNLDNLKVPPGNRLEALAGDREGQHSIRINSQYRVCFIWNQPDATDVEIVDYH